jgi:hypothetical protein
MQQGHKFLSSLALAILFLPAATDICLKENLILVQVTTNHTIQRYLLAIATGLPGTVP